LKITGNRKIRLYVVIVAVISVIILSSAAFFRFTPIGYCMSVPFRGFTEAERHIFIDNAYAHVTVNKNGEFVGKDAAAAIISEARDRVSDFFGGELQCDPIYIISDNPDVFNKSGEKNAYTFTLHRLFSYIAISHNYLNVDIVAHEITHAELYYRIMNGKALQFSIPVPAWFNEGLASINDYSEKMSEEAWRQKTADGTKTVDVTGLTKKDFSGANGISNPWLIQENYLMCRHEVKSWIDENGVDGLLRLIDGVREGGDFRELYGS
jgi:hypothetical protein